MPDDLHYFTINDEGVATFNGPQCTLEGEDGRKAVLLAERWAQLCKLIGQTPPDAPLVAAIRLGFELLQERAIAEQLWMSQQVPDEGTKH